jgi:diadenosine tetraphosphate (Ap4A) HIT family hydrolase
MLAIKKGIGSDYVQLSVVGKDVPHFHIHLIPRFFKDTLSQLPTKKYKSGESVEAAQKIIQALDHP